MVRMCDRDGTQAIPWTAERQCAVNGDDRVKIASNDFHPGGKATIGNAMRAICARDQADRAGTGVRHRVLCYHPTKYYRSMP